MVVFDQGYALVVGIGADLANTVDDAVGLADILQDPARCAYPSNQVHLLTGERATRDAILSALDILSQSTNFQSTVIVYFSGHGYQVASPTGEFYYLLPYGYDLDRLYQTAISGAEFTDRLRAIPAQKLLVLLDCCHAGGIGEADDSRVRGSHAPGLRLAKSPLPPEAQALLAEGSGRVLIASSQENELSFAGRPYSAFTLALIEALCGAGVAKQDGYVRVADLALHAREVVPGRTGGRQHPILHFEQADNFSLAYYAGGETQSKGLPFAVEPEIEPEPGAWTALDQRGQTVHGPQTNITGGVEFSGTFQGPVTVGGGKVVDLRGAQGTVYKPTYGHHLVIDGNVSGQVAVGEGITQTQAIGAARPEVTEADLAELRRMLADLKTRVKAEALPAKKDAALERVEELGEAIAAKEPDLATMEYVHRWFAKHLPGLAGAVNDLIVHPIVRKLIEAAGDALVAEFCRRFRTDQERVR